MTGDVDPVKFGAKILVAAAATIGLCATLKGASEGGILSACILGGTACYLNEVGKSQRPVATAVNNAHRFVGTNSAGKTLSNVGNNIATGAIETFTEATKAVESLAR